MNKYKKEAPKKEDGTLSNPNFFERNKKYYGVFVSLAITALFAWLSFVIGKMTHISAPIWALLLGVIVTSLGLVPKNILLHAKSLGIFNVACFATIIPSLATIKPSQLLGLGVNTLIIFGGRLCRALSRFLASFRSGRFWGRRIWRLRFLSASCSASRRLI